MKKIGIYPGSFQPATKAHLLAYKNLKQISGVDTFVVTTDKTPTPDAPLNFGEKEQILVRHGIPSSHIVKVQDWKKPEEVFHNFSEEQTMAIFAVNQKEADLLANRRGHYGESELDPDIAPSDRNKELWFDATGKVNYFQPYKGNEHAMEPLSKHVYVMVIDDGKIEGKAISTANIRQILGDKKYSEKSKRTFFRFVFGWYDLGLYQLITSKFRLAYQVAENKSVKKPTLRNTIHSLVKEAIMEIMAEEYGAMNTSLMASNGPEDSSSSSMDTTDTDPTAQRVDASKQKVNLVQQKKELEAKAKQNKQQRDNYDTTVKNYDKIQKKADRDALNAVNKQLSQPMSAQTGLN